MKKTISFFLSAIILFACLSALSVSASDSAETAEENEPDIIRWFTPGMTVGEAQELASVLDTFTRNGEILSSSDIIKTGDAITTKNGEYVASVRGDVDGEGEITILSYLAVKRYVMQTLSLEGAALAAADVDRNDHIDEFDYILVKRIYMGTYALPKAENAKTVPVLLYHHILPDEYKATDKWSANEITIAISEFRRHLEYITNLGINVATTDEVGMFVKGEILLPPDTICLTFDDGYKSNTYYAAPILREFGLKATVFSVMYHYETDYQEIYDTDKLQHITRQDLEPCSDVIDQQCHTWNNHQHLGEQTYNEIYADLMLSQASDYNTCFAYPNGSTSETAIAAVRDAGFLYAFSTVRTSATCGDDPYLIPRFTITSPMNDSDFLALLSQAH